MIGPPGPTGSIVRLDGSLLTHLNPFLLAICLKGPAGQPGPQGTAGPTGAKGEQGQTGASGVIGLPGPKGANGDQGLVGVTGPTGPAVSLHYSLTRLIWKAVSLQPLSLLPSSQGAPGAPGTPGTSGDPGPNVRAPLPPSPHHTSCT